MNIYIDLDNCLSKSYKSFIDYFNKELSVHRTYEDFTVYEFHIVYGITKSRMWRIWDSIYSNHDLISNIEEEEDAAHVTEFLCQRYNLTIITSRPPALKKLTLDWLKRANICFHKLSFIDKYKKSHITLHRGYLIEDYLGYIDLISGEIQVIVFDRPWNRDVKGFKRIGKLSDLLDISML
ncbi:hypothetical protein MUP77_02415 [Candidatus Bathyarchaeota archaeon]|nr:hypothetical protein [Candidatus Bathyarchaeota archaeon]